MSITSSDSFHAQLAAVIEVLANSAVAEICKLVDDGYAVLRLEITQNQREIDGLRRKLLVAKFQTSKRNQRSRSSVHVTRGPSAPSRARCNPATKSSTQGTGGEEEDGGAGFPVILKVEGGVNTLQDIQPPVKHGSETNTTPRTLAVEPENHLHRVDQRFNTCHHSNGNASRESHHPSSDRNNRFTTTSHDDGNLFTSASEWAEAGAGIEVWNNAGSLTTGNCSLDPPHNSGPHQEGRTGSNTDGREGSPGASEYRGGDVSGKWSNVAPSLAGNLDWEPDMVVVDSVPIKVDEEMSSEWIINRDGITRSAKKRLKKHGREEELEAAHSTPTLSTDTLDRTTGLKSSLVVVNSATSYGGLSSFSAIKTPRQVYPQANQDDNHLPSINEIASSSAREFSRNLSSIPPMALPSQPARDAKGQPLCCELCGKTFTKFQTLRVHQRVHTGEKPYGCRHCSKRFSHQHQMKNHERVHTGEKPYGCRHCSKRFSYQHQKKNHERVHTGEKPFRCPICGRFFMNSSNMKRHLRIHM